MGQSYSSNTQERNEDVMQESSAAYAPLGKQTVIRIHFHRAVEPRKGAEDELVVPTNEIGYLLSLVDDKRSMFAHAEIGIIADLYYNFRPPAVFEKLISAETKNKLRGLHVTGIILNGHFADDVSADEKALFWENIQKAITHLGLVVRRNAGIINGLDSTGTPKWSTLKPISTDKLVYE